MQQIFLHIFISSGFCMLLSFYLITNLQWYNYSLMRVIFKHHKQKWHFFYFLLPIICYLTLCIFSFKYSDIILISALFIYFLALFLWQKGLDKKLVLTSRVKRYFIIIIILLILSSILYYYLQFRFYYLLYILDIFLGFIISSLCENLLFSLYAKRAKNKIANLQNLVIIAITGSYGKTSMKNFIAQILSKNFRVYSTPRSVNTLKGLVHDVNENANESIQIYVAEAGARARGDIDEISSLLQQHYAVIGKVGNAHIEYFKDIKNTLKTKLELLDSKRLKKAFVQKDNSIDKSLVSADFRDNFLKITPFPPLIKNIESTLEHTSFSMFLGDLDSKDFMESNSTDSKDSIDSKNSQWVTFTCKILGRFNIDNIAAAILVGKELGLDNATLKQAVSALEPIPHRLQRLDSNGKIILDDSFNGNLDGMSEGIRLASLHSGRKVIVTPGLVEYDTKSNIDIAKQIDSIFDIVIITGSLNATLFDAHISRPQKILLKDKKELQNLLATTLQTGDLVLFANDAPSYI